MNFPLFLFLLVLFYSHRRDRMRSSSHFRTLKWVCSDVRKRLECEDRTSYYSVHDKRKPYEAVQGTDGSRPAF